MKRNLILGNLRLVNEHTVCTPRSSYEEEIIMVGVCATGVYQISTDQGILASFFIIIIIIIMSVMELGHLLTRSGLTYLEVSSGVCHDSFCQLGNSVSLSWAVCREAFCLHVVSSSSCIPVVCLEPVLLLIPLQCVNLFCNLSKSILLFFSYISSLLLLFSWHTLL